MSEGAIGSDRQDLAVRFYLGFGVLVVSFSAIFVRLAESSPVTVAFYRAAYAVPVLFVLDALARNPPRPVRQRLIAYIAGLILAGNHAAWHAAIELMGAGLATVVGSTHVVIMMVVGWLLLGQRPSRLGMATAPVVLMGVILISGVVGSNARGEDPVRGVLFGVVMASCYVAFLLLLRHAGVSGVAPIGTLRDATVGAAVGSLLLAPLDPRFTLTPSWPEHGWLLALAFGAQVLGWLVITSNLARVEAWQASILLVLEPAATVLWAYLIFGETFSASQALGLVLVFGGVAVIAVSRYRPPPVDVEPVGERPGVA